MLMIAERMVYSPTTLAAAALLSLALLGPTQQLSAGIGGWAGQALFCREHNPVASSGWCT
jgi:hypothetical protein